MRSLVDYSLQADTPHNASTNASANASLSSDRTRVGGTGSQRGRLTRGWTELVRNMVFSSILSSSFFIRCCTSSTRVVGFLWKNLDFSLGLTALHQRKRKRLR